MVPSVFDIEAAGVMEGIVGCEKSQKKLRDFQ